MANNTYKNYLINILFLIFPLSFILGNLAINLIIALILIFTFFFYKKKITNFNLNFFDKILFVFFLYLIIILIINFFHLFFFKEQIYKFIIYKTLLFLRFFLFYIVVRFLLTNNIINLKFFFISCSFFSIIICSDIFVQKIFGQNIFGIESRSIHHNSGMFGEELIAGGYLQKFSLFLIFFPFFNTKKFNLVIRVFLTFFFGLGIIFSGNKMPLILFIFSIFLYITFFLKSKKIKFALFTILISFFILNFYTNNNFNNNSKYFFKSTKNIIDTLVLQKNSLDDLDDDEIVTEPYVYEFYCFGKAFKKNPIFGGGIKSYRVLNENCNTHPHNYYFEILIDTGIIGFFIIIFLVIKILYNILKIKNYFFNLYKHNFLFLPFFLIFITEFFPLRSSGSFFSSNNASIVFFVLAILITMITKDKTLKETRYKIKK